MKKIKSALFLAILTSLLTMTAVFAQGDTLKLSLSRDWGYGGFNGDIQGTFTMKASGPASLVLVEFYIDETKIGEVSSAPFNLQFVTDNYSDGAHTLYAIGTTSDGKQITSQKIGAVFVAKEDSGKAIFGTIGPLLAVIFGALLLAAIIPLLTGRKTVHLEPGAARNYGMGGGICPKCKRPFAFHIYGFNLAFFKFDRCPYCGKWSPVRRASLAQLQLAEKAELEGSQSQVPQISEEDKLKKELDDSKYQNM